MLFAIIRQALYTMRLHWLWAALTISGILWGTASVVLLIGWGVGVHRMVETGLQRIGKNLVYISAGRIGEDLSPAEERRALVLDLDDAHAYRELARKVSISSAEIMEFMFINHDSNSHIVDV